MVNLMTMVLFGLLFAFFASQNTETISLTFLQYQTLNLPVYVVVAGALLIGLLLSWIISLAHEIGIGFTLRGKESKIRDFKKENAELVKQIHQLELQNTKLMALTNAPADDNSL